MYRLNVRTLLLTALAGFVFVLSPSAAVADHHLNVSSGMTLAGAPLALRGYDPVAYFTQNKPVSGKASIQVAHGGATYRFASEANKAKFEANPAQYLPAYGGYCAFGVSVGKKFDGDPNVWRVVDGKLYLNLNPDIQKNWQKDVPGNIKKADGQWKSIAGKAPSEL